MNIDMQILVQMVTNGWSKRSLSRAVQGKLQIPEHKCLPFDKEKVPHVLVAQLSLQRQLETDVLPTLSD